MDILQKWFPLNHRKMREADDKSIVSDHTAECIQVFCFPSAGSSAGLYRTWCQAAKNNAQVDFIPVEIPGRGNHISSPAAASVDELTENFLSVFLTIARPPFILYGHSFGALVAFQVVHTLQQRGLHLPEKLIVAGRHAPHMKDPNPLNSVSTDAEMIEEIKRMGGTPEVVLNHPEMLRFTLSQLRADLRTHESFRYTGQKVRIPIEAHCGSQDDANRMIVEYWKEVTEEDFHIKEFEGDHFFIKSLGDSYFYALLDSISQIRKSII